MLFFKEICEAMGYCCSARQPAGAELWFCQLSVFQFPISKCMYMCTTCTSTSTGYTAEVNKSLS